MSQPTASQEDSSRGSVSHWLDSLHVGDSVAAQQLWNRYFSRLVAVAQSRLSGLARDVSGEDVALSALKSVMIGVRENRYPDLEDRSSLWPLLVTVTARKAISQQRRQLAQKRHLTAECSFEDLKNYIGTEPSPEFVVEVADELDRLVRSLGDPTLRRIVEQKTAGFTNEEIATQLGCSVRTVLRKIKRIRREWRATTNRDYDTGESTS